MYQEIPLNKIRVKNNYRQTFDEKKLRELASSIKQHGVIEPILVRPRGENAFEIIAGERRVRASKLAGLVSVPAIVRDLSDERFLETQLVENMQREGVPFMEEAYGIKNLRDNCDLDVSEICKKISKSNAYVYMMLQLTTMCETAQAAAARGEISKAVAVQIARLPDAELQAKMAVDLRRQRGDRLISDRVARQYIQDNFSAPSSRPAANPGGRVRGTNVRDYSANWKQHLLSFTAEQFEQFKSLAAGKTDTQTLISAVETVMLGGSINE